MRDCRNCGRRETMVYKDGNSMRGLKAQETEKWGRETAESRYGPLKFRDGAPAPADRSMPQAPECKRGSDWADDTPNNWVRGFGKNGVESAEGKPNFDKGKKR